MITINDVYNILNRMITRAEIIDVDHEAGRARVKSAENESAWIQWLEKGATELNTWFPPIIGQRVLLLCPSGELNQGVVVGALNTGELLPPSNAPAQRVTQYPDGTRVIYDFEAHALTLDIQGDLNISLTGNATINCDGNLSATVQGDSALECSGNVSVNGNSIKLNGGAGVVTGQSICAYTGAPHADCSTKVFAGK